MELDLKKSSTAAAPPMDDLTFALHALAVIEVHSHQEQQGTKMTIRQIAQHDSYLCHRETQLMFSMMCSFGQHAVPVYEKYLTTYNKPIEYEDLVTELKRRINVRK